MPFPTISFFAEINIFRFWPKTIDYSPWFQSDFFLHHKYSLEGATELKTVQSTPLEMPFPMVYITFRQNQIWPKTMDYSALFYIVRFISALITPIYLEGATELKFVPICSNAQIT